MAKLIHIRRERLIASLKKFDKLLTKDPFWQKERKEIKRAISEEKARRDAEYARKLAASQEKMEEAN